jgi:hypothetical protein
MIWGESFEEPAIGAAAGASGRPPPPALHPSGGLTCECANLTTCCTLWSGKADPGFDCNAGSSCNADVCSCESEFTAPPARHAVNTSRGVSAAGTNGRLTWLPTAGSAADCEFGCERRVAPQTGAQSQFVGGAGCGVRNRGLDFGGHYYAAGELYRGHFFARGDAAATLAVALVDSATGKTLATQVRKTPRCPRSWANFSRL